MLRIFMPVPLLKFVQPQAPFDSEPFAAETEFLFSGGTIC